MQGPLVSALLGACWEVWDGGSAMNRANAMEGFARERRGLSPVIAVRRGMPSQAPRRSVAEAIAEDPAKLCLAGRLISWATAGNEARFELVASLRQAIEAGTYGVAACDAADKLMEGMRR